jgi:phosphate-selective porin OprO/OprP
VEFGFSAGLVTDRDQGALIELSDAGQVATLQGGVVNGGTDGSSPLNDNEDDKDAVGRLFLHPFRAFHADGLGDLGLGLAASSGHRSGLAALPSYKSPGQATVFSYGAGTTINDHNWRVVPQAYFFWRNFGLLAELAKSESQFQRLTPTAKIASTWLHHDAWQVQGSWVLTGEKTSFKGVKLSKEESSAWGSLALVGRYEELRFDGETFDKAGEKRFADPSSSITRAQSWTLGLNYVPVSSTKLLLQWSETHFMEGAKDSLGQKTDREKERLLLVRAQFTY